jgi:hypothetical protein
LINASSGTLSMARGVQQFTAHVGEEDKHGTKQEQSDSDTSFESDYEKIRENDDRPPKGINFVGKKWPFALLSKPSTKPACSTCKGLLDKNAVFNYARAKSANLARYGYATNDHYPIVQILDSEEVGVLIHNLYYISSVGMEQTEMMLMYVDGLYKEAAFTNLKILDSTQAQTICQAQQEFVRERKILDKLAEADREKHLKSAKRSKLFTKEELKIKASKMKVMIADFVDFLDQHKVVIVSVLGVVLVALSTLYYFLSTKEEKKIWKRESISELDDEHLEKMIEMGKTVKFDRRGRTYNRYRARGQTTTKDVYGKLASGATTSAKMRAIEKQAASKQNYDDADMGLDNDYIADYDMQDEYRKPFLRKRPADRKPIKVETLFTYEGVQFMEDDGFMKNRIRNFRPQEDRQSLETYLQAHKQDIIDGKIVVATSKHKTAFRFATGVIDYLDSIFARDASKDRWANREGEEMVYTELYWDDNNNNSKEEMDSHAQVVTLPVYKLSFLTPAGLSYGVASRVRLESLTGVSDYIVTAGHLIFSLVQGVKHTNFHLDEVHVDLMPKLLYSGNTTSFDFAVFKDDFNVPKVGQLIYDADTQTQYCTIITLKKQLPAIIKRSGARIHINLENNTLVPGDSGSPIVSVTGKFIGIYLGQFGSDYVGCDPFYIMLKKPNLRKPSIMFQPHMFEPEDRYNPYVDTWTESDEVDLARYEREVDQAQNGLPPFEWPLPIPPPQFVEELTPAAEQFMTNEQLELHQYQGHFCGTAYNRKPKQLENSYYEDWLVSKNVAPMELSEPPYSMAHGNIETHYKDVLKYKFPLQEQPPPEVDLQAWERAWEIFTEHLEPYLPMQRTNSWDETFEQMKMDGSPGVFWNKYYKTKGEAMENEFDYVKRFSKPVRMGSDLNISIRLIIKKN